MTNQLTPAELPQTEAVLGETRNGRVIGKGSTARYMWAACVLCGKERWVQCRPRHNNKLESTHCKECKHAKLAGSGAPNWKGGRYKEKGGYVIVYITAA